MNPVDVFTPQLSLLGSPSAVTGPRLAAGQVGVMTWNVQHASPARSQRQAAWLTARPEADIVVLTEVAATNGGQTLAHSLVEAGYSVHLPAGGSDYRTVLASRVGTVECVPAVRTGHLPHRLVAARIALPGTTLAVVGMYVPSRGPRERRNVDKRAFQAAATALLPDLARDLAADGPTVITGDLNVIEPDHQPAHAVFGRWEYDFYRAFGDAGYLDAYRHMHPDAVDHSWFGRRSGDGYRFDHTFCSSRHSSSIRSCDYLHEPRLTGLSDHSALSLVLERAIE